MIEALSVAIQVFGFQTFRKRVFLMAPIHHHFELRGWSETKIILRFWIVAAVVRGDRLHDLPAIDQVAVQFDCTFWYATTVPMATNPFTFDRPLPPAELVDRHEELEQLLGLAKAGQSVRLAAPRRYGKTTLLGALAESAWEVHELIPAVVDLSRVTSVDDVVTRLSRAYERGLDRGRLRATWRAVRRRGSASARVSVPGVGGVAAGVGPAGRPEQLEQLHELLDLPRRVHERTGQACLVIFDEFQDLLTLPEQLDGILRSHLQHHHGIASYLFAGSQPSLMQSLFGDRDRPLFEQARALVLGRLPAGELADWIEARLLAAGRDGLADQVDELVAVSAGHPQRAMLLAHLLFEQRDDDPDALVAAIEGSLRQAADGLEQTWRDLTPAERRLLGAVAAGHDRVLGKEALAYTGHGKGSQAAARDQLVVACHLEAGAGGRLRFVDPLLPLWMRERS